MNIYKNYNGIFYKIDLSGCDIKKEAGEIPVSFFIKGYV
jgi:hypothetical protein